MDIPQKSDEQIAKEKAAIDAMKNAKANMDTALARIADLEYALGKAISEIKRFKGYVPASAYLYGGQKTLHSEMDETVALLGKRLG